jgi:hypothetical protein
MTAKKSLLRNLALLGAIAIGAPLLSTESASAAGGQCISEDSADGSCWGCNYSNGCWYAECTDAGGDVYSDGGCPDPLPPPILV